MPLHKIRDFDPNYRDHFEDQDVIGHDLYAGADKAGSVDDLLVDDAGKLRYLVINTGFWILGKQVLLPIGRARIDGKGRRVAVDGLTREQVEALPKYDGTMPVNYEHEEKVRSTYRPKKIGTGAIDAAAVPPAVSPEYDRDTYNYDRDPELYNLNEQDHQSLRLYEERLVASKTRAKTGEVAVGKRVETETAKASVPLEKERVVIERTTPVDAGTTVALGDATFEAGEVTRMEVYEETPDIHKEAFVREEVSVRKEIDRDTANVEETLRREELDIDTDGRPVVDQGMDTRHPSDRV
ncbi:MAG: DUF2382 domain-containing protein [Stenomitos frigidus ULC029]